LQPIAVDFVALAPPRLVASSVLATSRSNPSFSFFFFIVVAVDSLFKRGRRIFWKNVPEQQQQQRHAFKPSGFIKTTFLQFEPEKETKISPLFLSLVLYFKHFYI
jgi:hypothetical protein